VGQQLVLDRFRKGLELGNKLRMQVDAPLRHKLIMARRSYVLKYISRPANRTPWRCVLRRAG
jgi:hypothetical protein